MKRISKCKRDENERVENSFSLLFYISNPCLGLYNFCLLFFTLNAVAVCLFYFVCLLVLAGLCWEMILTVDNSIGSEVFLSIDPWFIYLRTFQFIQSDCDLIWYHPIHWKKHLMQNSKIKWCNSTKKQTHFHSKIKTKEVKEFGSEQQAKCFFFWFFFFVFICICILLAQPNFLYWHEGLSLDISFQSFWTDFACEKGLSSMLFSIIILKIRVFDIQLCEKENILLQAQPNKQLASYSFPEKCTVNPFSQMNTITVSSHPKKRPRNVHSSRWALSFEGNSSNQPGGWRKPCEKMLLLLNSRF